MGNLFNYDNKVFTVLGKATDAIILGVFWFVCSIPIFTIGASSSAFYYAYNKCVRQRRDYAWKEFFEAFKSNFKQATKIWLLILLFIVLSVVNLFILYPMQEVLPFATVLMVIMLAILMIVTLISLYVFPYQARFENNGKEVLKNATLIMIANFLWTLLLAVLYLIAIVAFIFIPLASIFVPAIYMALANPILERIFKKYMLPEDLQEQIEYEKNGK